MLAAREASAQAAADEAAAAKTTEDEAKQESRSRPSTAKEPPNLIEQALGSATVKKAVNTAMREITRSIFGTRKRR